jgi:hypothetical protein
MSIHVRFYLATDRDLPLSQELKRMCRKDLFNPFVLHGVRYESEASGAFVEFDYYVDKTPEIFEGIVSHVSVSNFVLASSNFIKLGRYRRQKASAVVHPDYHMLVWGETLSVVLRLHSDILAGKADRSLVQQWWRDTE